MSPLRFGLMVIALAFFVFIGSPASITYPNQAYTFFEGTFAPVPGFTNLKAFAVEDEMVLGVTQDGRMLAHGVPEHWLPGDRLAQLTNIVAVGLNYSMGAALRADGRVIEFGRLSEFAVSELTNVIALDVAGQAFDDDLDYKVAVTSDGRVETWGYFGLPVSATIPGVISAAGGWAHVVALKDDGTVMEWVFDEQPAAVDGVGYAVAVAAGGMHSVALQVDGTVVAWGENFAGQLNIPAGLSNVVAIAAAEHQSLALKSDGTLAAWGQNYLSRPATVPAGLSNVIGIAVSELNNLALVNTASIATHRPTLAISLSASNLGPLTISLSGDTNRAYAIESSVDLVTWQFLRNVTNATGTVSFNVWNTNASRQFFRAAQL